jgi:hypothetical protein
MPSDPQRSRARKQLRTRDAIPLDEVEADFGMKGMLSFLQIPREEASRNLEARRAVDLANDRPMGHSPVANGSQVVEITTGYGDFTPSPTADSPMHVSPGSAEPVVIADTATQVTTPTLEQAIDDRPAMSPQVSSSAHFGSPQP